MEARPGTVYLVGAGPGDPGLVTVRARELVASADLVLYDALAPPSLLAHARPDAEVVYVGKKRRTPGEKPPTQAEIDARLVAGAAAGRSVVRLKGGDPFVFGRGGEEALALEAAGIPFEVVPGVTAGIAALAYAGIPLTHRELSSDAVFVTGHTHRGDVPVDWSRHAGAGTLVVYMGVARLAEITDALLRHGRPAQQPAAAVRWGTRPDQAVIVGTLGDLAERCEAAGMRPPAVIVAGEVVRLREPLAWFERRPLYGRRVAVLRPDGRAREWIEALEAAGAEAIHAPAIETAAPDDPSALDDALLRLAAGGAWDVTVFTSRTTVDRVIARLHALGLDARAFAGSRIAAVGPGTAAALAERGLQADRVPDRHDAEGLLEAMREDDLEGVRILLPRAAEGRDVFPDGARARGATVDVVAAYRTVLRPEAVRPLVPLLEAGALHAVVVASPSQVRALVEGLGEAAADLLAGCVLGCIGEATAEAVRAAGLSPTVAAGTGADEMVATLAAAIGAAGRRG